MNDGTTRAETSERGLSPGALRPRSLHLASGTVGITDVGHGPTLLFVHAGMWSFVWRDLIARLAPDFRCVAVDFPGFGTTPDPGHEPTMARLIDSLRQVVEHLDLDAFTLVVHDLGGPVGLAAAAEWPDRVRGLVAVNTFVWEPDRAALRSMLRLMSSGPMTWIGTWSNLVPRLTATRFGVGRHLDRAGRRAFLEPFRDPRRRRRFHRMLRAPLTETFVFRSIERGLGAGLADVPMLSVFGERNDPFEFQTRLRELFPKHQSLVIEGGNHFPMMDDPELVATTLRAWWNGRVEGADL